MTFPAPEVQPSKHAHYGEHWGEGAARCFSIETDILDEDHAVRLMPVPDSFVCPISASIMVDPVATVDGCIYERQYIERWFRARRQQGQQITSPITGLELPTATLMPLVALQRAIEAYLAHRPELKRDHMAGRSFEEAAQLLQSDLLEKQAENSCVKDKLKRLRQANKTLLKMVEEANARILELEADRKDPSHVRASSSSAAVSSTSKVSHSSDTVAECCAASQECSNSGDVTSECRTDMKLSSNKRKLNERCVASIALPLGVMLILYCISAALPWTLRQRDFSTDMDDTRIPLVSTLPFQQSGVDEAKGVRPLSAAVVAAREHMEVKEVNPVFLGQLEQLRYGNLEEKQRAAFMLRHFAAEHSENQIAIAKAGAIEPLVQLLEDPAPGLREEAARALWNLARNHKEINVKNQVAIGSAGAIKPLVRLLEDEVSRVRIVAAAVLNDLAIDNIGNQIAIARTGAIGSLISLLQQEEAPALVMAAGLLQSLAKSSFDPQVASALAGAISPLVDMLKADTLLAQEHAAASLGTLAAYSKDIQVMIGRAGAIVPLVDRLKGDMMQGTAAVALRNLAENNPENQAAIAKAGAIVPLVKLLEDGMPAVRSEAARALWNLARENMDNQVAIVREGAVIPLVALLKGDAQEEATITLLNLSESME